MFDLLLMLSRYVFLFYIVLFLWQGIVYIAYEQGGYLTIPLSGDIHTKKPDCADACDCFSDISI